VIADPHIVGQFDVQGSHTYAEDNIYTTGTVTISDISAHAPVPPTTATVSLGTAPSWVTIYDAPLIAGAPVTVSSQTEGKPFTVEVGTFTDTDPNGTAGTPPAGGGTAANGDYTVSINWGDASVSAGTVAFDHTNGSGQPVFDVFGTHTYREEIPSPGYQVTVQITDTDQ